MRYCHRRLLVACALVALAIPRGGPDAELPRGRVVIQGQAVEVEVARTPAARRQGLSGRAGLAPGTGLLFLHPEPARHAYWMKDMRFAIDIVWLRDGRIVDVSHRVPPLATGEVEPARTWSPRVAADAVLELPAGYARAHGFDVGLRARLELPEGLEPE